MAEVAARALLKKGGEGSLFLADWHGKRVVIKARLPKTYRPAKLDAAIRGYRTVHEPQLMHEAKKAGVAPPFIFLVDLTTSNMILNGEGKIFLVDFGLGEKSMELEARGVDLHLLKRALQSTHYQFAEECFKSVMAGYRVVLGVEEAEKVLEKIREIERRGRYVAERRGEA